MPQGPLPSPDEILAREATARRPAAYAAIASALLVVIAMIVEWTLSHSHIPDFDATDLAQTLALVHDGQPFPRSFLTAVAQFQLDHAPENFVIALLRGASVILLLPMVLFVGRAVRDRGGQLGAWVRPAAIAGYVVSGILSFVIFGVLQLAIYRTARDHGFLPSDIWDAVRDSPSNGAQFALLISSALAGITLALTSVQAVRVGLLPKVIGYAGVLIGVMFVIPLDQSNVIRAIWFVALAFIVMGRLATGTPPGWTTGTAVAPEPRQPAAPRGKKGESAPA